MINEHNQAMEFEQSGSNAAAAPGSTNSKKLAMKKNTNSSKIDESTVTPLLELSSTENSFKNENATSKGNLNNEFSMDQPFSQIRYEEATSEVDTIFGTCSAIRPILGDQITIKYKVILYRD